MTYRQPDLPLLTFYFLQKIDQFLMKKASRLILSSTLMRLVINSKILNPYSLKQLWPIAQLSEAVKT